MLKRAFIEGMSRAAATVSVVTTAGGAGREGVTVSAMTSVCVDPGAPSLLVCMHHQGRTAQAICHNKVFCVNVLREEHGLLADLFAGRLQDEILERFASGVWTTLTTGAPVVTEALASFDCQLTESVRCGSHWIFIGEVIDLALGEHKPPLVYANRTYRALCSEPSSRPADMRITRAANRSAHAS
jgi:flavin reductase (DIM6/NTAB) family NADH-FMN oxidoreductase RutF